MIAVMPMTRFRLIFALAALLTAAACSREEQAVGPEVAPPVHTIRAGFAESDPGTRSRLEYGETEARVLWSQGDAFKMYRMSDNGYSQATYTTEDDGVEYATFTTTKVLGEDDSYTCIYPAASYSVYKNTSNGDLKLRIPVPPTQEAVPGGLAEGLNKAAAWSSDQDAELQFSNLLSIVRFRLSGEMVSSLASVTLETGKNVAGDATLYYLDGKLHFGFTSTYSTVTYPRSTRVTLTGPFTEGQDYCMALVPATLDGFEMIFRDTQGRTLTKKSSKSLTLNRSRSVDFGTIAVDGTWERSLVPYMKQTKGSKPNVLAVLADGFTESELDFFEEMGQQAMDYLFSVEPYKTYRDYFTVYLCPVPSNESGAGVIDKSGNIITPVDNYFGSRWPADSYSNMTANASVIQNYLKTHIPELVSGELSSYTDVPTLLLINDIRYGGICHTYGSGWAYCQVPYQKGGSSMRWSFPKYQAVNPRDNSQGSRLTTEAERDEMGRHVGDWRNTVIHEFGGHAFGRLSDEYWNETTKYTAEGAIAGHTYAVPYSMNVSGYYDNVPWKEELLDHLDEWVARNPDYARVSIFHGAQTSLYYRWRSEMTSCMIDNRPYYNLWSRILIVRRIMEKTGLTFDMADFIAKDVTTDPIRPTADTTPEEIQRRAARARMVPEMPMLPPPVFHEDE